MDEPARQSPLRLMLRFLGSLELAMVLLAIVTVACIVGTIVESRFDTDVARTYVYDAPWFIAWLVLLCLNLICAVLVRGPLRTRQAGFAITHAGVVVLLVGAIVGRMWGVEGMLTLVKGEAPSDHFVINEKLIAASQGEEQRMRAFVQNPLALSPSRPLLLRLKDARVSAVGYSTSLGRRTVVEEASADAPPAIHVVLREAAAPHSIEHWLVLGDPARDRLDLGEAMIRFLPERVPVAPSKSGAAAPAKAGEACREVQFVFARMPDMAVVRALAGPPTGVRAVYRFEAGAAKGGKDASMLQLDAEGRHFEVAVERCLGKDYPLEGTPWSVRVVRKFADFRMKDKEPVSVSDQPNNPALMLEVTGRSTGRPVEAGARRAGMPHGHPSVDHGSASGEDSMIAERLTIYRSADGRLSYDSRSGSRGTSRGALALGQEFSPGWGSLKLMIDRSVPHANVREELARREEGAMPPFEVEGIQFRVEAGQKSVTRWVEFGESARFDLAAEPLHVAFGQRMYPLGFAVALDGFEVERDEGTMNPAGFKSHVRFIDPSGKPPVSRSIWMNHPADYPDFPGVGLLGTAFKFSQASWDPRNLSQTTLQVVRDPGWPLKWIGSLMICAGLFATFYMRPAPRGNGGDKTREGATS